MKTVGKCKFCGDPVYDFQAVTHEGCKENEMKKAWPKKTPLPKTPFPG